MTHGVLPKGIKTIIFAASLFLFLIAWRSGAQDFYSGVRGGMSFKDGGQNFYQGEAYAGIDLPWPLNFYSDWCLQPNVEISAGGLTDGTTTGFIGTLGPVVQLRKGKFPITAELGFCPTILSQDHFGAKDFGDPVQFTSSIGLKWEITKHFSMECRIQHMSNARIAKSNPGLDVGMLSAGYNF
jgi:hypothetical protein